MNNTPVIRHINCEWIREVRIRFFQFSPGHQSCATTCCTTLLCDSASKKPSEVFTMQEISRRLSCEGTLLQQYAQMSTKHDACETNSITIANNLLGKKQLRYIVQPRASRRQNVFVSNRRPVSDNRIQRISQGDTEQATVKFHISALSTCLRATQAVGLLQEFVMNTEQESRYGVCHAAHR